MPTRSMGRVWFAPTNSGDGRTIGALAVTPLLGVAHLVRTRARRHVAILAQDASAGHEHVAAARVAKRLERRAGVRADRGYAAGRMMLIPHGGLPGRIVPLVAVSRAGERQRKPRARVSAAPSERHLLDDMNVSYLVVPTCAEMRRRSGEEQASFLRGACRHS